MDVDARQTMSLTRVVGITFVTDTLSGTFGVLSMLGPSLVNENPARDPL